MFDCEGELADVELKNVVVYCTYMYLDNFWEFAVASAHMGNDSSSGVAHNVCPS
jgi:hypothetical protein